MNVKVNVWPFERSLLPKAPLSAVTVWTVESMFVQVTVLLMPITTVIDGGPKAKFWILTLTVLWAAAEGAAKRARPPAIRSAAKSAAIPR